VVPEVARDMLLHPAMAKQWLLVLAACSTTESSAGSYFKAPPHAGQLAAVRCDAILGRQASGRWTQTYSPW